MLHAAIENNGNCDFRILVRLQLRNVQLLPVIITISIRKNLKFYFFHHCEIVCALKSGTFLLLHVRK